TGGRARSGDGSLAGVGFHPGTERRELRPLRTVRRRQGQLAILCGEWRADQGRRHRGTPAGDHRHSGGERRVSGGEQGGSAMSRIGKVERTTKESSILVQVDLDGTGEVEISTGVPFYDHMLTAFGAHGSLDLKLEATVDVHID